MRGRIIANSALILLILSMTTLYSGFASMELTRSVELLFRSNRFDEAIAFADLKIASAKNPANQGKLTAWKATVLYNLKKFKPAMETAEKALAYGNTESLTYMILAMSNHELGHLDKVPQYIAKARAAHKVMFPSGFIEGLFDAQMRQLENELQAEESKKECAPSVIDPGRDRRTGHRDQT